MSNPGHIDIGGDATHSILITGSHNVIQIGQAAAQARSAGCDPAQMLRVAAILAAPVFDPRDHNRPPALLDLRAEWARLARAIHDAHAPILLTRLVPPTLATLRRELSPRVAEQGLFPHVLHVSGRAWAQGLLLEEVTLCYNHPHTLLSSDPCGSSTVCQSIANNYATSSCKNYRRSSSGIQNCSA
ncbi:hypothetical protein [Roseiflexus sp.]|uniref:hypothetical protein n=1 Tax=Roseiflexus sp. TaxID=2562120 RepID=UPI0025831600|nr:hypothetical protein [Roseiflexus sp.]